MMASRYRLSGAAWIIGACLTVALPSNAESPQWLPTGQLLTPQAANGSLFQDLDPGLSSYPEHRAGQAATVVASHDGKTLAILTSGFNRVSGPQGRIDPAASNEYVFLFDITHDAPRQIQVLEIPNTDSGIAFSNDDARLYLSGGVDDDLHTFARKDDKWAQEGTPIALGHAHGLGLGMRPSAAGLAVSTDGRKIIVADRQNDAITIVDPQKRLVTGELDLRPGKSDSTKSGVAGGEYPDWVAIKSNTKAYVSSQRDREIVVVDLASNVPRVISRIEVQGTPNRMILNSDASLLYVATDNSDLVAVVDTTTDTVRETIDAAGPTAVFPGTRRFRGASPNSLALSPDGSTLYVTDGGTNALAIIPLGGASPHHVAALVPTGSVSHWRRRGGPHALHRQCPQRDRSSSGRLFGMRAPFAHAVRLAWLATVIFCSFRKPAFSLAGAPRRRLCRAHRNRCRQQWLSRTPGREGHRI